MEVFSLRMSMVYIGNSCRKGVDAMSGVTGEVVLATPNACPADACIEPVVPQQSILQELEAVSIMMP